MSEAFYTIGIFSALWFSFFFLFIIPRHQNYTRFPDVSHWTLFSWLSSHWLLIPRIPWATWAFSYPLGTHCISTSNCLVSFLVCILIIVNSKFRLYCFYEFQPYVSLSDIYILAPPQDFSDIYIHHNPKLTNKKHTTFQQFNLSLPKVCACVHIKKNTFDFLK